MKKYLLIDDEEIFNFIQSEVIHNFNSESETITYSSASEAIEYLKACKNIFKDLGEEEGEVFVVLGGIFLLVLCLLLVWISGGLLFVWGSPL